MLLIAQRGEMLVVLSNSMHAQAACPVLPSHSPIHLSAISVPALQQERRPGQGRESKTASSKRVGIEEFIEQWRWEALGRRHDGGRHSHEEGVPAAVLQSSTACAPVDAALGRVEGLAILGPEARRHQAVVCRGATETEERGVGWVEKEAGGASGQPEQPGAAGICTTGQREV